MVLKKKKSLKKKKPYKRATRGSGAEVHNFIKEWREHRGFTSQVELAKACGLPSQTINRLEAKTLAWTAYSLQKIAAVLKCTEGDLISRNPNLDTAVFELWNSFSRPKKEQGLKLFKDLAQS